MKEVDKTKKDIGKLSIMYGIDIEKQLADIVPIIKDDGKEIRYDKQSMRIIM